MLPSRHSLELLQALALEQVDRRSVVHSLVHMQEVVQLLEVPELLELLGPPQLLELLELPVLPEPLESSGVPPAACSGRVGALPPPPPAA